MFVREAVAAGVATLMMAAPAQGFELGAADDAHLVGSYREGTLESMHAHGVKTVRLTAWQGRSNANALRSAWEAKRVGLKVQVVLGVPAGETPGSRFTAWAASTAADFAEAGASRFSILNEPDLWIPAADRCDTDDEVRQTVIDAGYRYDKRRVKTRVRRTKIIRVRGKRKRVGVYQTVKRVSSTRVRGRKVVRRGRVPLYRTKWTMRTVLVTTTNPRVVTTTTPARGCLAIHRARAATETWDETVPAVRLAAPGATILLGETSPVEGTFAFTREALRRGLPRVEGWAHHPYPQWNDQPHEVGMENIERIHDLVSLPMYWTEFGSPVRTNGGSLENARANWERAEKKAQSLGVKQLVAYGWWATDQAWDTAAEGVLH